MAIANAGAAVAAAAAAAAAAARRAEEAARQRAEAAQKAAAARAAAAKAAAAKASAAKQPPLHPKERPTKNRSAFADLRPKLTTLSAASPIRERATKNRSAFVANAPPVNANDTTIGVKGSEGIGGKTKTKINGKEVGLSFGAGAFASTEVTVAKSLEPAANGKSVITVNSKIGIEAHAGADLKGVGIDGGFARGKSATYQASVTPAQLKAIKGGALPPSPYNPDKMPPGTRITLKHGNFSSSKLDVSYDGITLGNQHTVTKSEAASVTKLAGNKVSISVGPETEIKNQDTLGVGALGVSVAFHNTDTAANSKLRQVTVDLNNKKGRDAYAMFLQHGTVPTANSPKAGITDAAVATKLQITDQNSIQLGLGPLSISQTSAKSTYQGVELKFADGSSKMQVDQNSGDGYQSSWIISRAPNGRYTGDSVSLHANQVPDPELWSSITGGKGDVAHGRLDINITQSELSAYQQRIKLVDADYNKQQHVTTGDPNLDTLRGIQGVNDLEWTFRSNNGNRQDGLGQGISIINRYSAAEGLPPLPTGIFNFTPT